jgi:hypothetical protein
MDYDAMHPYAEPVPSLHYRDLPMDDADATLVALAENASSNLVFTTKHRDLSRYRISGRQEFMPLPSP